MDNKRPDQDIKVQGELSKKLENFWYYNKWKVIFIAIAVVVLAVCVYSCIDKPKYDITVVYAGPYTSTDKSIPNINNDLSGIMPDSIGENGASVLVLSIFTEEQARIISTKNANEYIKLKKQAGVEYTAEGEKKEREKFISDGVAQCMTLTNEGNRALRDYLMAGQYTVFMFDPETYEYYAENEDLFVPLSKIFGENVPVSAENEYAVRLGDTDFYKNSKNGIDNLPADTLVCLRVEPLISGCSGQGSAENYQKSIEMFKAIVGK